MASCTAVTLSVPGKLVELPVQGRQAELPCTALCQGQCRIGGPATWELDLLKQCLHPPPHSLLLPPPDWRASPCPHWDTYHL